MELNVKKEILSRAISEVSRVISGKTPFPILTGVKLIAKQDSLTLIGSNSDVTIKRTISDNDNDLKISKPGSVVVSAKYFNEIVKKLPEDIYLKVEENEVVTIQAGEIFTKLHGFRTDEYPRLPEIDDYHYQAIIPSYELIEIIKQTAFAVSKSETRPVLTGVHISISDNEVTFTATDSHRLALRKQKIMDKVNGSCIVPSRTLLELTKLFHHETIPINVTFSDHYIVFESTTTTLYSRLIEGNYPNISGLIPQNPETIITLNTRSLLEGIDRACLFAGESRNTSINLEIRNGSKIRIYSISSEAGRVEETQKITSIQGDTTLHMTLDGRFMKETLKAIKEEEIQMSFCGTMRPVIIKPKGNSDCIHLISPVRSY